MQETNECKKVAFRRQVFQGTGSRIVRKLAGDILPSGEEFYIRKNAILWDMTQC
jgi:hypothetical protein